MFYQVTVQIEAKMHTAIWMKIEISMNLFVDSSIFENFGRLLAEFIISLVSWPV
jgi:hypothetical protein